LLSKNYGNRWAGSGGGFTFLIGSDSGITKVNPEFGIMIKLWYNNGTNGSLLLALVAAEKTRFSAILVI